MIPTTWKTLSLPLRCALAAPWCALLFLALLADTPGGGGLVLDRDHKPTQDVNLSSAHWTGTLDAARLPAGVGSAFLSGVTRPTGTDATALDHATLAGVNAGDVRQVVFTGGLGVFGRGMDDDDNPYTYAAATYRLVVSSESPDPPYTIGTQTTGKVWRLVSAVTNDGSTFLPGRFFLDGSGGLRSVNGGFIRLDNGGGYIDTSSAGGYIKTREGGFIDTSDGGYINTNLGGAIDTSNGGGSISTIGGGYLNTSFGGSIDTSSGGGILTNNGGGAINTSSGGFINTSYGGGFITTCGDGSALGGNINTSADGGGVPGGSISTVGGGNISTFYGGNISTVYGGSIDTSGGGGNISTVSGGFIDTSYGGGINTSNGGGPINTAGGGGFIATLPKAFSAISYPLKEGSLQAINDSTTNTWGATITGGGSYHVLGYYDGAHWTVMAK